MREVIARRLLESKTQVPHFYLEKELNAEALLKLALPSMISSKNKVWLLS